MSMRLLNIGCGIRLHKDWVNIDIAPVSPKVQKYNILEGIPFRDNTFDAVYCSHILEHIPKNKALAFIRDCYRVLKPGGILRVVAPDLEIIARLYLDRLDKSLSGDRQAQIDYDWILLEMYDQTVRDCAGGEMRKYLTQQNIPNAAFVQSRIGSAYHISRSFAQHNVKKSFGERLASVTFPKVFSRIRHIIRSLIFMLLPPRTRAALQIGYFRLSGEIHQCMYDRYSLAQLLQQVGFTEPKVMTAHESTIPNWTSFNLDTEPDGTIYKPDSLWIEATKM